MSKIVEEIDNDWKKSAQKSEKIILNLIAIGLSFLITAPLFIIIYRYIPDLKISIGETFRLDHILTFSTIFLLFFALLKTINKYILYSVLSGFIIFIAINQIVGNYSAKSLINDYKDLISFFEDNPINIPFLADEKMTIRNSSEIRKAIDYANPVVRDFAVKNSLKFFNEPELYKQYNDIIRYFSIFKAINSWNYVKDPQGEDYYSKASETTLLLAGDCDDYSILMAALIKSIGGEPRLIHTESHLYPEVKVGTTKDLEKIIKLIKGELFYKESLGKKIYYHLDNDGNVWLNFDYSGNYPGAKFMNEKIIGILNI